jgi:ADP-ribose pyrophosphatase
MSIRTTSSRVVYRNRWITVREDSIERPDGSPGIYSVVEKPNFALIIPVEDGNLYLVEQYRYPVGARFLEFPQGAWEDNPCADPLDIARGELQEETGLLAERMDHLGRLFIAYGITSQAFDVFRASGLSQGAPTPDAEEQDLIVKRVSVAEFENLIRSGKIQDAGTVSAWQLLQLKC